MPIIEIAGERAFVQRSHYSIELFERLQEFACNQENRKRVYDLMRRQTPPILIQAARETIRKTGLTINSAVVKRYDEGTPQREYGLRMPSPNYMFGGIVAVSLSNVALMEVTGEDGEVHEIDCLSNTAVIMKARLQNRVFSPQEDGPRHVIMLGHDAIAALGNWRQPDVG